MLGSSISYTVIGLGRSNLTSSWIRISSGSASIWGSCCFLWRNRYITFDSEFPSYKPLSQITYQIEFLKLLFFLWMEILNFNKLFWLLFLFLACVAHTYAGLKLSKTFLLLQILEFSPNYQVYLSWFVFKSIVESSKLSSL